MSDYLREGRGTSAPVNASADAQGRAASTSTQEVKMSAQWALYGDDYDEAAEWELSIVDDDGWVEGPWDTWQEAKAALITNRQQKLRRAQHNLRAARRLRKRDVK